jgi:hypothetical protein
LSCHFINTFLISRLPLPQHLHFLLYSIMRLKRLNKWFMISTLRFHWLLLPTKVGKLELYNIHRRKEDYYQFSIKNFTPRNADCALGCRKIRHNFNFLLFLNNPPTCFSFLISIFFLSAFYSFSISALEDLTC